MEEKRAEEISTGRIEFIINKTGRLDKEINPKFGKNTTESETLSQCETLVEPETLPVCTRTPRMLITSKSHYIKHLHFVLMIKSICIGTDEGRAEVSLTNLSQQGHFFSRARLSAFQLACLDTITFNASYILLSHIQCANTLSRHSLPLSSLTSQE